MMADARTPGPRDVLVNRDGTPTPFFVAWMRQMDGLRATLVTTGDGLAAAQAAIAARLSSAAAAPTTGAHARGEIVWNSTPSAAGKAGWVCVTAGTPGDWKPFGVIDA